MFKKNRTVFVTHLCW